MTEDTFDAERSLTMIIVHVVPFSTDSYLEFVCTLSGKILEARRKWDVTTRQLVAEKAKI